MSDQKISVEVKSTLKWMAAGLALFGLACLAKKVYQNFSKNPKIDHTSQLKQSSKTEGRSSQRLNTHKTEYSEFYFDKDLQIQFIQQSMPDHPQVEDIYLNSPLIARDEFIKYTRQMRKRRRLVRKINQDQYINTILTYQNQVKELLFRSRMELVESLNMDPDNFANMQENYEAVEELKVLQNKSQQILRNKLITDTHQKKMSNEKLKQIMQQQLCFMHNKMYDRIRNKFQKEMSGNQQQILIVIQALIEDIIYEKFGYEIEDVERKILEINYSTKQRDEARNKMNIDIVDFNYDSLESLEDPSQIPYIYKAELLKQSGNTFYRSQTQEEKAET